MSDTSPLIVGIDVGTTNTKAVVFDVSGRAVSHHSVSTPTHYPRLGWAYYEPDQLWECVLATLRAAISQLKEPERIISIVCASMGESGVPLDASGNPTYNIIAWFDQRTAHQAQALIERGKREQIIRVSGLDIHPMFGLCKLMWLRDHEPAAFTRTIKWLNVADFIAYRLSGAQATDYSLASRTLALDLHNLQWNEALIREVGIDPSLFAELVPSGTTIGVVQPDVAKQTGLPEHTIVATGGHDHVCAALALGVTVQGSALDSMGSAEAIFLPTQRVIADDSLAKMGYAQGAHVVGGYYLMGGQFTSGAAVEWFRHALAEHVNYEILLDEAQAVPPGSLGVTFLPHLRTANTPNNDALSMGAFIGLTTDVHRGVLFHALLEGIAFEMRSALEPLLQLSGITLARPIVAAGGGTRNSLLLSIKAAVFGMPLLVQRIEEATALGAALLGGLACGLYASPDEAAHSVLRESFLVNPSPAEVAFYNRWYQDIYKQLYETLRPLHHATRALLDLA